MKMIFIDIHHHLYHQARTIRKKCFFDEMNNAQQLLDDAHESNALHLVGCDEGGMVLATGRMHVANGQAIISQMAVDPAHQGKGFGTEILKTLIQKANQYGTNTISLSARVSAIAFYEKFDFKTNGKQYPSQKTGIMHQDMMKGT